MNSLLASCHQSGDKLSQQTFKKDPGVLISSHPKTYMQEALSSQQETMKLFLLSSGQWNGAVTKHRTHLLAVHFPTVLSLPTEF
jgi:hypothetical protein